LLLVDNAIRHPEVRAPQARLRSLRTLGCVRASKGDGPSPGRSSFEARPPGKSLAETGTYDARGHLRMTGKHINLRRGLFYACFAF
jgi:hypothetical protein